MSGFQHGGPPFGPPYNYGGQYMPQFQGGMPFNNNMMPPHQPPVQQPAFQQHRPPFPQMPQTPNQVHFANNGSFHNNAQFPPPPFHHGQPPQPPQPQYFNYGPYGNNPSAPLFTPNMQSQGFGGGPSAPLGHNPNAMTHMMNSMPNVPSASNTPIRSTFTPQRPPVMGYAPASLECNENVVNIVPVSPSQLPTAVAEPPKDHSVLEEHPSEPMQGVAVLSDQPKEPEQNALSVANTGQDTKRQTPTQEEAINDVLQKFSEVQEHVTTQEEIIDLSIDRESVQHTPSSTSSKDDIHTQTPHDQNVSTEAITEIHMADDFQQPDEDDLRRTKRGQAKQALKDLHDKNVGFHELSAEQLNLDFLRQLYLESGLAIMTTPAPEPVLPNGVQVAVVGHSKLPAPLDKLRSPEKIQEKPPSPTKQVQSPALDIALRQPAAASKQISTPPVKSPPPKATKLPPTEKPDPAKGRQDYIARLLAAKAGIKQDSVAEQAKASEAPAETKVAPTLEAEKTQRAAKPQVTNEVKKPDMKDAKQTELIRQRLEALKNSSKGQKLAQSLASSDPPSAQAVSNLTQPLLAEEMEIDQVPAMQPSTADITGNIDSNTRYDPSASFFAPTYHSPVGALPGLPGLPGLSSFSVPADSSAEKPVVISDEDGSEDGEIVSEDEPPSRPKQSDQARPQSPALVEKPPMIPIRTSWTPENPKEVTVTTTESRKRPTAADFIDSPPHKLIKRPSSSDPIHLVIEVSDDDDEHAPHEDGRSLNPQPETSSDSLNGRRGLRELPPLSDFPARSTNAISKPPAVQSPSLAQREEEIRLMRLKIAEVEHRRKGKKASETPSASTPAIVEAASSRLPNTKQPPTADVDQLEKAIALAKQELQEKERLEAQRRTQARLAAQVAEEAAHTRATAEKKAKLDRKAALEAALPKLDAQIEAANTKLEFMKKQQDEIRAELQRGNQGRTALLSELEELLKVLEGAENPGRSSSNKDDDVVVLQNKVAGPQTNGNHPTTTGSSESAPVPPKITIPSRQTIESKGSLPTPQTARTEPTGEVMDIASSSEDEGQIIESKRSSSRPSEADVSESAGTGVDYEPQDAMSEGSIDDYEPAAAAAPEVDQDPVKMATSENGSRTRENEDYEPSLEVEVISPGSMHDTSALPSKPQSEFDVDVISMTDRSYPGNVQSAPRSISAESPLSRSSLEEDGEISDDYEPPESSFAAAPQVVDTPGSSVPVADVGEVLQRSEAMDVDAGPQTTADSASKNVVDLTEDYSEGEKNHDEAVEAPAHTSFGHYTPYESPLRLFSSYRFHPQYVHDVPGGFRSLTFNHKINPKETLCRWELAGGICNDPSCKYQHFRDLPLTDNNLLLQLGSVHEGASQKEKDAYIAGLKQMIAGMRDKNLRDVTAIASQIVAYRSKFLEDPSRVLTNI